MSLIDLSAINTQPKKPLEDIFEEEPVSLDVFIKDQKFMNSEWSLSPVQTELVQLIERIYMPDLYPQMAQEFGGYWKLTEKIPMKNLISAEWGKGCVSEDTEIYSPKDGIWRQISSITFAKTHMGKKIQPKDYPDQGHVQGIFAVEDGDTDHTHGDELAHYNGLTALTAPMHGKPFVRGKGKMLRVRTITGHTIKVYEGHLFPAKRGLNYEPTWTAAGALREGNFIATAGYTFLSKVNPVSETELEEWAEQAKNHGAWFPQFDQLNHSNTAFVLAHLTGVPLPLPIAQRAKRLWLRMKRVGILLETADGKWVVSLMDEERQQVGMQDEVFWDMVSEIEELGEEEYWDMNIPALGTYVAGTGIVNSNSGKDHSVRIGVLRVAYLLLCLKSPQKYFGMPEQDSIHMLNVAANAPQANRAFFKPLTQAVKHGWFADKADPKQGMIQFAKNVEAVSGHSDAEAQEGLNILVGVADEIDAFRTAAELVGHGNKAREASTTAESILTMIESSASTRFPETHKRVAISYPRYLGSTIQKLTAKGKKDMAEHPKDSIFFASGPYATWEVNPLRKKSQFAAKYRENPIEAAAKYECKPYRATAPYFRNPEIFSSSIVAEEQPLKVDYRLSTTVSSVTGKPVTGWEPIFTFSPELQPMQGARYAIHADLAIKNDRAGISMSHIERFKEVTVFTEDGATGQRHAYQELRPVVRNDFTISFEADIGETPPREIQIRWVRALVFELINRGFLISLVTYDGFQSTDSLQIMESHGIETDRVSTDKDQSIWKSLKDVASEGRLKMAHEQLLMDELEALSMVNGKIDHPPAGSKDLADAFASSIVGALTVGGEESEDRAIVLSEESIFDIGDFPELPLGMEHYGFQMPIGLHGG